MVDCLVAGSGCLRFFPVHMTRYVLGVYPSLSTDPDCPQFTNAIRYAGCIPPPAAHETLAASNVGLFMLCKRFDACNLCAHCVLPNRMVLCNNYTAVNCHKCSRQTSKTNGNQGAMLSSPKSCLDVLCSPFDSVRIPSAPLVFERSWESKMDLKMTQWLKTLGSKYLFNLFVTMETGHRGHEEPTGREEPTVVHPDSCSADRAGHGFLLVTRKLMDVRKEIRRDYPHFWGNLTLLPKEVFPDEWGKEGMADGKDGIINRAYLYPMLHIPLKKGQKDRKTASLQTETKFSQGRRFDSG
ncbi:hypothetical protein B0H11DRAFT_2202166 [Mycena galericulata]|nr:hypothetical protein B0H11DRAFT_2202166 [Mycena galericulata]